MAVPDPNSSTGGYLTQLPQPPADYAPPLEDQALSDLLQAMVAGITGLDGTLVRPRWQPTPPTQPAVTENWVALGIVRRIPDDNPQTIHLPDQAYPADVPPDPAQPTGADLIQRHEKLELLCSFYGPSCQNYAGQLRDGLYVAQNRETLVAQNTNLVDVGDTRSIPELINTQWVNRCDLLVTLRREVNREYPILNLASAGGTIDTAVYEVDFNA